MGANTAGIVAAPRPKWRSYLLLSRVSNLPTVWSNVIAGASLSGAAPTMTAFVGIAAAVSLLYTAGMFLNDACDEAFDRRERPGRPLPAGHVTSREVFVLGYVLMTAGVLAVAWISPHALPWALGLATAIVFYSFRHKGNPLGPFVMGVCRGLVYALAASAAGRGVTSSVLVGALFLLLYVAGLTQVAKRIGQRAGLVVPILIAGISLLDAVLIVAAGGSVAWAAVAAAGFALTLALQRVVPGT